jgi:hypothetical protein
MGTEGFQAAQIDGTDLPAHRLWQRWPGDAPAGPGSRLVEIRFEHKR